MFTPTQHRILEVLKDGKTHTKNELLLAIDSDGLASDKQLQFHLSKLREKLRPQGTDVVCQFLQKSFLYRHIRLLASPYDGRK